MFADWEDYSIFGGLLRQARAERETESVFECGVCVAYQCEPNSLPMLLVNPKNLGFFGKFGENPQGKLGRERDRERKCVCVL